MTQPTEAQKLQALKSKADMLGLTYHPNIGLDKLKEKVDAKMAEQPSEDPVDAGEVPSGISKAEKHKEAGKLVRILLNTRDPNKKDWPGEIFSVGNSAVGFFKKYVPYGTEWHVPQIIVNSLKSKKVQVFISKVDARGNKTKEGKLIPAYNLEVLPPLTPDEISDLAKAQQGSGRIED